MKHSTRPVPVPPADLFYDGCLQEKMIVVNSDGTQRKVSVPLYYIVKTGRLPPKKLQYDGWQYEKCKSSFGYDVTLPQYWILSTHTTVPEELRIPGWDTDKFVYRLLNVRDVENIDNRIFETMEIYGTIYDAYEHFKIGDDSIIEQRYSKRLEPYKLSDDGTC